MQFIPEICNPSLFSFFWNFADLNFSGVIFRSLTINNGFIFRIKKEKSKTLKKEEIL